MQAIPQSILARLCDSPETLTAEERALVAAAVSTHHQSTSLLVAQKEAASLLGINRTTVWRLVNDGILRTVEVVPGTFRYRRADIERLANHGWQQLVAGRREAA